MLYMQHKKLLFFSSVHNTHASLQLIRYEIVDLGADFRQTRDFLQKKNLRAFSETTTYGMQLTETKTTIIRTA